MADITTNQKDSIVDQVERVHRRIAQRAYELFQTRDGWGDALGDWLRAEQELVLTPAVELCEKDGNFLLTAALPGASAKDITVDITSQDVVINAVTHHKHSEHKGQIHHCDFTAGQMFRSLSFPKPVDADKAVAAYHNGMLNITVPMAANTRAKRIDVVA